MREIACDDERGARLGRNRVHGARKLAGACGRARRDCAAVPDNSCSARHEAEHDGSGMLRWTPSRRGGCNHPKHIFRRSCTFLPQRCAKLFAARVQAVCPGPVIDTVRACAGRELSRGNFLAHSGGVVTTDLFLATGGLDPLALEGAVPPTCLRGIDPAPIVARDGVDTLLMLPTWTPRRPAVHLLPSFAPLTDVPLAFRFEISAHADGEWSPWAASVTIGAAEFAPLPSTAAPLTCDVDVFLATPAVDAVRLRVRIRAVETVRWMVGLSAADEAPVELRLDAGAPARLDVPALSQMEADVTLGARICSPTSVAMVLGYWGRSAPPAAIAAEI